MNMRNFLIAGNWKMNAGPAEAKELADKIVSSFEGKDVKSEVLICPPYVSIPFVAKSFRESSFKVGSQNVYTENNGAYTGEISTEMLKELHCDYVITGHSERREYFGESDELIAAKSKKVFSDGLIPIVCVGEKLEDRKNNSYKSIVKFQVQTVINSISEEHAASLVIAYEPVWAIGTGETATPEQAQEMHQYIRSLLSEHWNSNIADQIRILYGGSMKPGNAQDLLSQADVDGGLIGGASLDASSFSEIITIAESISK